MDGDHRQPQWTLSELTQEAGVSIRTVRYYIAEGLLPPPDTSGPRSTYTQGHLDRLRFIDLLKTRYLPLKEIRRHLSHLNDMEIRRLLDAEIATVDSEPQSKRSLAPARPPDRASDYIDRLLNSHDASHASRPIPPPAPSTRPMPRRNRRAETTAPDMTPDLDVEHDNRPDLLIPSPLLDPKPAPVAETESVSWRRIPLSDDAELLIRDDAYHRKRDRIDWLITWARKVFT